MRSTSSLPGAHRLRREAPAHDAAHRRVLRRVEQHEDLGRRHRPRAGAGERDALRAREAQRLRRDLQDVGVLRDRPERLVAGRLDARDRRLGAQPRPHVVRIPARRVARGIDEVERIDVDHCHRRFPRQAEQALADDVALDLARAAHDRVGARRQQAPRPRPARRRRAEMSVPGPEHVGRRLVEPLAHARPEQLHDARLRADLLAAGEPGQRARVVQAEDLDVDPRPREPLAHDAGRVPTPARDTPRPGADTRPRGAPAPSR